QSPQRAKPTTAKPRPIFWERPISPTNSTKAWPPSACPVQRSRKNISDQVGGWADRLPASCFSRDDAEEQDRQDQYHSQQHERRRRTLIDREAEESAFISEVAEQVRRDSRPAFGQDIDQIISPELVDELDDDGNGCDRPKHWQGQIPELLPFLGSVHRCSLV